MSKTREWPARVIYMLIVAALAISLMIMAALVQKVSANPGLSEWSRVSTPSEGGWVLAPESDIIDYAVADDGDVAYAIVYCYAPDDYYLLKSGDGAATWSDLNDALDKVNKSKTITDLLLVATDGADANFLAVALSLNDTTIIHVYVSKDGGTTFRDANEVKDVVTLPASAVSDLAVSVAGADGTRELAISGQDNLGKAALFRATVTGDIASAWEDVTDVTDYPGWDDSGNFTSVLVTDVLFSPNWKTDSAVLAVTVSGTSPYTVHLQSGTWGETSGAWNKKAGFVNAVPVLQNKCLPVSLLINTDARAIAGITLPSDYSGDSASTRYAWVWVNYYTSCPTSDPVGEVFRVKNGAVISVTQQIETQPWLTNVSYWGTIAEGKAIAGVLGDGGGKNAMCCHGVDVYRKDGIHVMDICCPAWEPACKKPTGIWGMAVSYVSADKAYAVALGPLDAAFDEGAWSVSFDDGDTWNQLSLIDTAPVFIPLVPTMDKWGIVAMITVFAGLLVWMARRRRFAS